MSTANQGIEKEYSDPKLKSSLWQQSTFVRYVFLKKDLQTWVAELVSGLVELSSEALEVNFSILWRRLPLLEGDIDLCWVDPGVLLRVATNCVPLGLGCKI